MAGLLTGGGWTADDRAVLDVPAGDGLSGVPDPTALWLYWLRFVESNLARRPGARNGSGLARGQRRTGSRVRLNVLVIDRAPPVSASQGNELIARSVFPLLRDGHRLTLVAPVVAGQEAAAREAIDGLFDAVHLVPRARRLPSLAGWLEATLSRSRDPPRRPARHPGARGA